MRIILMTLAAFVYCQLYSQVPSPSYKIVGYIEGMPDQELYLDYYDKGIKYRHPTFSKDGNFQFIGGVSALRVPTGNTMMQPFQAQQWKQYFKEDQQLIKSASIKGDPAVIQKRKELLKKYVKDLHSSYAGALIPNFCTIEKSLTSADWIEIYGLLSGEMKDTYYGRKIGARIQKP